LGIDKSWVRISYTEHTPGRMVIVKNTLNYQEVPMQFSFPHLTLKSHEYFAADANAEELVWEYCSDDFGAFGYERQKA